MGQEEDVQVEDGDDDDDDDEEEECTSENDDTARRDQDYQEQLHQHWRAQQRQRQQPRHHPFYTQLEGKAARRQESAQALALARRAQEAQKEQQQKDAWRQLAAAPFLGLQRPMSAPSFGSRSHARTSGYGGMGLFGGGGHCRRNAARAWPIFGHHGYPSMIDSV